KTSPAGRRAARLPASHLRGPARRNPGGGGRMSIPVADVKSGQIQARPQPPISSEGAPLKPTSESHHQASHGQHPHHHKIGVLPSFQSLLQLIVIAIFIITFCAQPFRIPSESMESTLLVGDFLLVNKQTASGNSSNGILPSSAVHRGDIV